MFGLAETFSKQSDFIELGDYKNEFETIKTLHTLPHNKQQQFNALTEQLLHNLQPQMNKQSCAQRSRLLREEGNRVYKTKCGQNAEDAKETSLAASRLYTHAILAAENAYDELALGYANRAIALQDFGYFQQAYDDCCNALEYGYPERLQVKLLMRQAHCAWQLGNVEQLTKHTASLKELQLNEGFAKQLQQLEEQLKELQVTSIPPEQLAQDQTTQPVNYKVSFSDSSGRHLVATSPIKQGELLFTEHVDSCFVPIEQHLICQQCAASLLCAPIPCPDCQQRVVYCSRHCRDLHSAIHSYECGAYARNLFSMLGVSHLALRLLLKHLPQWLQQLAGNSNNAEQLWQALMTLAANHSKEPTAPSLQSLRMITQLNKAPPEELLYHALCANLLQSYLFSCTSFYEGLKTVAISSKDWHPVIAALILRNAGQLLVNGHVGNALLLSALPSKEFALLQPRIWLRPLHLRLGCLHMFSDFQLITAINLPHLSLCNHACNPSLRTKFDGNTVSNFAAKDIAVGEEILNCYSLDYKHSLREQRQQQLEEIYKFRCSCSKCERSKPDTDYLTFHRYRCERAQCGEIFVPVTNLSWWQQSEQQTELCCTACGQPQLLSRYDQMLMLLDERCDEPRMRRKLYKSFAALDAWLLDFNSLKLSLARQLIEVCFAAREAGAAFDDSDYVELIRIIEFLLAGIAAQRGRNSLQYISNLTYLLDMIGWKKHKVSAKQLQIMRDSFAYLAKETREIFDNYCNDFIEQYD